jgi:hypothetical protein
MTPASAVLYAVAKELAQTAKDSLPELRDGEQVQREWYADGVYYRETVFNGETFISQYDFRQRESTSRKEDVTPKKRQRKSA